MIRDVFGKIGGIKNLKKTEQLIIVEFKKALAERARRVLLYLFNLCVIVDDQPLKKNEKHQAADLFYPVQSSGDSLLSPCRCFSL